MSREGAGRKSPDDAPTEGGTPMWIGIVYFLGAVGAIMLAFLLVMQLAAAFFWDDAPDFDASIPLVVLWGGLTLAALALWASRRRP